MLGQESNAWHGIKHVEYLSEGIIQDICKTIS